MSDSYARNLNSLKIRRKIETENRKSKIFILRKLCSEKIPRNL